LSYSNENKTFIGDKQVHKLPYDPMHHDLFFI